MGIARAVVSFTPEKVQEFTVQTSAYSAEYGNTGGGVINVTTKSGSNNFNGTALLYHRNPATNAGPYVTGSGPRTPNNRRYTQGSITVGGPVYLPRFGEGGKALYDGHNKTFFFFAYEPRWLRDFLDVTTLLPTAAERSGDFRNLWNQQRLVADGRLPVNLAHRTATSINSSPSQTAAWSNHFDGDKSVPPVWRHQFIAGIARPQCTTTVQPDPGLNVLPGSFIDRRPRRCLCHAASGVNYFIDSAGW